MTTGISAADRAHTIAVAVNTVNPDAIVTPGHVFPISVREGGVLVRSGFAEAGVDIVRVSCPDAESTAALPEIVRAANVPIVADIHFHYKRGIEAAIAGAACLRINPGNIGSSARVKEVVQAAKDHGCSMRIGVNAGSLEKELLERYGEPCPEAMVESALTHAKMIAGLTSSSLAERLALIEWIEEKKSSKT